MLSLSCALPRAGCTGARLRMLRLAVRGVQMCSRSVPGRRRLGWSEVPGCGTSVGGLPAAGRAELGDLLLEVLDGREGAVHTREPEVGDLIELAQRAEDGEPDLMARDLGGAARTDGLLDAVGELLQRVLVDGAALAGSADSVDDLLAAERLGDPAALDDGEHGLLDRGEPTNARRAGPSAARGLAVVDLTGVDHPTVRVTAERAAHRTDPFPTVLPA